MYSIYTLVDPRDDSVCYVGMSEKPYVRYGQHLCNADRHNPEKWKWIRELMNLDLIPSLKIIEKVTTRREAVRREAYWIAHYIEQGSFLINKKQGYPLLSKNPVTMNERASWLRALFNEHGNFQCDKLPQGEMSYRRRLAAYSANFALLKKASVYLLQFGLTSYVSETRNSEGHWGNKTVYRLSLACSKENFIKFSTLIGVDDPDKLAALNTMIGSYTNNLREAQRKAQLKGADARRRKSLETSIPQVFATMQDMARRGIKLTESNCTKIPGYYAAVRNYDKKHSRLVKAVLDQVNE